MKTLKFLLFAGFALSMVTACSENYMQGTDHSDDEIKLTGTKWKLAALVDVQTHESIEPEPKNCNTCYTLEFDSDTTATGLSILNEIRLHITPSSTKFGMTKIWDGENNNVSLYYEALQTLDTTYEYSKDELKLYYAGKKKYLLYKPLLQ